jgi:hypothetical protein
MIALNGSYMLSLVYFLPYREKNYGFNLLDLKFNLVYDFLFGLVGVMLVHFLIRNVCFVLRFSYSPNDCSFFDRASWTEEKHFLKLAIASSLFVKLFAKCSFKKLKYS